MIKLRRNTVAAADRARKGEQDLAQVAGLLSEAATAQGEAAGLLRTWPFDHGQVAQARGAALSRLESARALLGRMHDAATEDEIERLRRELRQTYLELAQRQSALLGEVAAIGDRPVDRRTRFDTRRAGRSQINLGQAARAVIDEHAIVSGSGIFTIVHGEIDVESSRASGILLKGAASTEVLDSQGTITGRLEMLAAALGDDSAGDAPFERGGGSDGGGASGDASGDEDEPALPSIAELRLLRSMQSVMLDDTRATASSTSSRPEGLEELGRRQRALSDIAETLFERVRQQQDPIKVDHTPPDRSPPAWGPRAVKDKQSLYEVESRALDPLPSLDALLGLEEHGINVTPPARPTPRDSVEALLFEMRTAASDLEVEHDAGLDVQRMQARALERLDAMIDRARRQQGSDSPDPTGGDTSDSQEAAGQTQGQQATQATSPATGEQDGTGGDGTRSPIDPRRSGPIEDERRQWGGLPPRVREMLEQGRRDAYATLYEQLTGEYFRTLAEDPAP